MNYLFFEPLQFWVALLYQLYVQQLIHVKESQLYQGRRHSVVVEYGRMGLHTLYRLKCIFRT